MEKLKLLLDENIGAQAAAALRRRGYAVACVLENAPGSTDVQVLERALKEGRILITLDRDFGALVYRDSKRHVGVLYLRLQKEGSDTVARVCLSVLRQYGPRLRRRFTIASETRVRIR